MASRHCNHDPESQPITESASLHTPSIQARCVSHSTLPTLVDVTMPAIKREHSSDDSDASSFRLSESTPPRDPRATPQKGKKPKHTNITPTKKAKPTVKREDDNTEDDGTSLNTTPKRGFAAESGSVFGKARISADVKQIIANDIVSRGLASVDLDTLEREVSTLHRRCGSPKRDERWSSLTRSDGPEQEPAQVAAPGQPSKHPPATVQPDQDHDLDRTRVSRQDSVMHVHG